MKKPSAVRRGPRTRRILLAVHAEEHERITSIAAECGLTTSRFLRELGQGYSPKSRTDAATRIELAKLRADNSRLGNLLKWWLAEKPGEGVPVEDVRRVLSDVEELTAEARARLRSL
jgi:hypothetical protein